MEINPEYGNQDPAVPRDFTKLTGLTHNFSDEEWAQLDEEILKSIVEGVDEDGIGPAAT